MAKAQQQDRLIQSFSQEANLSVDEAIVQLLHQRGNYVTCLGTKGRMYSVKIVPGHSFIMNRLDPTAIQSAKRGPSVYPIMIITSHPRELEDASNAFFIDTMSDMLRTAMVTTGVSPESVYVTAAVKFAYPDNRTSPLAGWVTDCIPLLRQEIKFCKPKYVYLMGAQAVASTLPDVKLKNALGTTIVRDGVTYYVGNSMGTVAHDPGKADSVQLEAVKFFKLTAGGNIYSSPDMDVTVVSDMVGLVGWMEKNKDACVMSIDAEWGGSNTFGSKLRTIQISTRPGTALVIHVSTASDTVDNPDADVFKVEEFKDVLNTFLNRPNVRLIGHHLRADAMILKAVGIDIIDGLSRGVDTLLAHHTINSGAQQKLEVVCGALINADRWDFQLTSWIANTKSESKVEDTAYLCIPDDILIPYGARDASETLKLAIRLLPEFDKPSNKGLKNLLFKVLMPSQRAVHEMEMSGLTVDLDRLAYLEELFNTKYEQLLQEVRDEIGWAEFNINSTEQKSAYLFGGRFAYKTASDGSRVSILPEGVKSLNLEPYKTSGKHPDMWDDLSQVAQNMATPSTDNETISVLATEAPFLKRFSECAYLAKVISNLLSPPELNKKTGKLEYTSGVRPLIELGRIRTHFSQAAITGRWKSSDTNLQNWPSQRESDFKKIFGNSHRKVKSMLTGDPDMPVLIASDLKTAEVNAIARLAGDTAALEILTDPKRDIHSEQAIKRFQLPYFSSGADKFVGTKRWMAGQKAVCAGVIRKVAFNPSNPLAGGEIWIDDTKMDIWPGLTITVKEGEEVREKQAVTNDTDKLRTATKTIIFGIPYQRGAKAVARKMSQEGIPCTPAEAKESINEYLKSFPDIANFLELCKHRVFNVGYMDGVYGRRRYFPRLGPPESPIMQKQMREGCNWPVQNMVADYMNVAVTMMERKLATHRFRLKLAVHDSCVLACRGEDAEMVINEVVLPAMSHENIVPHLGFYFGADCELTLRYATEATEAELVQAGVPAGFICPEAFTGQTASERRSWNLEYPTN